MGGLFKNKTLYFSGCTSRVLTTEIKDNYEQILKALNVEFIKLDNEKFCCGQPLKQLGYDEEFEELKKNNQRILNNQKVAKIITNDAQCYDAFKKAYNAETEHILNTIHRNKHALIKQERGKIVYHDSCFLARHANLIETPRNILKAVGYEIEELNFNKKDTKACGCTLALTNPQLAKKMAQDVLKDVKTRRVVTANALCYKHLKDNSEDIQVYEISQLIKGAIRKNE